MTDIVIKTGTELGELVSEWGYPDGCLFDVTLINEGINVVLTYVNGTLASAMSSANIPIDVSFIDDIPDVLGYMPNSTAVIGGVIYITKSELRKINHRLISCSKHPYSSAMSAVTECHVRGVKTMSFAPVSFDVNGVALSLVKKAFPSAGHKYTSVETLGETMHDIINYRSKLDYTIVGVRLTLADKNNPLSKSGFVINLDPDTVSTKVTSVTYGLDRTGLIIPTIGVEPTRLGSRSICWVTIGSLKRLADYDIRLNDTVVIGINGNQEPVFIGVDYTNRTNQVKLDIPTVCPECGEPLFDGRCLKYSECKGILTAAVSRHVSQACVCINGLDYPVIHELVSNGTIKKITDVYGLTPENLKAVSLTQNKINAIITQLRDAKHVLSYSAVNKDIASRFIAGLNLEGVGIGLARSIATGTPNLKWLVSAEVGELSASANIDPVLVSKFMYYLSISPDREFMLSL